MVRFLPFDRTDEEGVNIVLQHIDFSIQYGEDLEVKEPKVKTQKHNQMRDFDSKFTASDSSSRFVSRSWMKSLQTSIMMRCFKTKQAAEKQTSEAEDSGMRRM